MRKRLLIHSGSPWEDVVGYSRAVRIDQLIEVSGTTAVDGSVIVGEGNVYEQAKFIFQKIAKTLEQCGSSLEDIVRTRMYITDINQWEDAGKAHGEVFHTIKPASTLIAVAALVDERLLIEIEATAYVPID